MTAVINALIGLLSAVIGGTIVSIIREVIIVKKEKNAATRIAKVTLTNEMKNNYQNLIKKLNYGKSLKDYIIEQANYGYNQSDFTSDNWEKTKVDIAKMNPDLGESLYKVYTFTEQLQSNGIANEIDIDDLNQYETDYQEIIGKLGVNS